MRVISLAVLLLCTLILGGCMTSPVPKSPPPTSQTTGTSTPSITIEYPAFDAGVPAGSVEVVVAVLNFTLTDSSAGGNSPGTGHIIYYRDVVPPTRAGMPALVQGSSIATDGTSYTWRDVGPGTHTFAVQLVQNDDTPLQPAILDAIDLTAYQA